MILPSELLDWKVKTMVLTRNKQTDEENRFTCQEIESGIFTGHVIQGRGVSSRAVGQVMCSRGHPSLEGRAGVLRGL